MMNDAPPPFSAAIAPQAAFEQGEQQTRPYQTQMQTEIRTEIQLSNTREERRAMDDRADFYALLVTCEHLETAYIRGSISDKDYTNQSKKLIAQYKTLIEQQTLPGLNEFVKTYNIDAKAAVNRFTLRIPATQLHGGNEGESKSKELDVFHAVQNFITTMDALKLDQRAVDELHPSMSDLMDSLNKLSKLPMEHVSRVKVQQWLVTLSNMRANEEISEEQARQMSFDLDQAYNSFHKFIAGT